jgi:hypothetical protein
MKKLLVILLLAPYLLIAQKPIVSTKQGPISGIEKQGIQIFKGIPFAAPPVGATNKPGIDLYAAAQRYRELLIAASSIGVIPQVELWGFSKNLSKLGEVALIAI